MVKKTTKKRKYIKKNSVPLSPSAVEEEIMQPSAWFRKVQRHQDVQSTCLWYVNKEKIYENYHKVFIKSFDSNGNEVLTRKKEWSFIPRPDYMKVFSEEVIVLPNGKVITPIRQYCETKILPTGTNEAFFYDFGSVNISNITEGTVPNTSPIIRSNSVRTDPRGTRITVGYQQTEDSPVDIIASTNRAFALESINDETKQVMNAVNSLKLFADDEKLGNIAERCLYDLRSKIISLFKKQNNYNRENKWVNHKGKAIKDDSNIKPKDNLTIKAILKAKSIIQDEGLDDSNLILYTSGKAIRDLIFDKDLAKYLGKCSPEIITENTLERILGINLVRSSNIPNTSTKTVKKPENILQKIVRVFWGRKRELIEVNGEGKRSVLFIPNVAFGLVSGVNLVMEAQRRNELQAIHITGTQKIAGLVKNKSAIVRISHG